MAGPNFQSQKPASQGRPDKSYGLTPCGGGELHRLADRLLILLRSAHVVVNEVSVNRLPAPHALLCLEHSIQDARTDRAGNRRAVSRQMQFVEIDSEGKCSPAGYAPYLDYRPLKDEELPALQQLLAEPWLNQQLESKAISYAIAELLPRHIMEVRDHRIELIDRTRAAVTERLTKEINYWDHRAQQLRLQESAGQVIRGAKEWRVRQTTRPTAARASFPGHNS